MHEITNKGGAPRGVHDKFGNLVMIPVGATRAVEIVPAVAHLLEDAQGRGEPIEIRMLADDEMVENYQFEELEPPPPPPLSAIEVLAKVNDLSYHELLKEVRRLCGDQWDLGIHPRKVQIMQRLRNLVHPPREP